MAGTSWMSAGPMPSRYARNGDTSAVAKPHQKPPHSVATTSTMFTHDPVTNCPIAFVAN